MLLVETMLLEHITLKSVYVSTEALALYPQLINGEKLHDFRLMLSNVTNVINQCNAKVYAR